MFFCIENLEKQIVIQPENFTSEIENEVLKKLILQTEGTISLKYGFIISIVKIENIGDAIINDEGAALFNVKYCALTFKPIVDEVLEATVSDVESHGIFLTVGPMKIYVVKEDMPSGYMFTDIPDKSYKYDDDKSRYLIKEVKEFNKFFLQSSIIKRDSNVRVRIKAYGFKPNEIYGTGTFSDDFLGLIDEPDALNRH